MYPDGLTDKEKHKVKELCAIANISNDDALKLLKENEWDVSSSSRRVSKEEEKALIPCTSKEHICEWSRLTTRFRLHEYTFYLPDLYIMSNEFRNFIERELIDGSTQRRLETSRHLNWWQQIGQKLYPLSTTGDGNCLLHAASLGMWGVHDRQLTLRETLYEMLRNGSRKDALWRRWKWAEHNAIHSSELALTLSEDEWQQEWDVLVALATPMPRKQDDTGSNSTDQIYESLETIHVFALAHVLKRPIIVVSDTILRNAKGEELSPVAFGGIYLPLECPPSQCHRSPLVLCYDSSHFSPLVTQKSASSLKKIIPIIDSNRRLLPVHFAVDPGPQFTWWKSEEDSKLAKTLTMSEFAKLTLISEYMDIIRLDVRRGSIRSSRRVRSAHAPLSGLLDRPIRDSSVQSCYDEQPSSSNSHTLMTSTCNNININNNNTKGMTLASSGISKSKSDKWRIINEIRSQVLRTLRLSSNTRMKEKPIDPQDCLNRMNSTCILACELQPTHHKYMDMMINEYMKRARQRFEEHNMGTSTSDSRKRMSRAFSIDSLSINCINSNCQMPASASTTFLCAECYAEHKMMMLTFDCEKMIAMKYSPCKSSTCPSFCGYHQENGSTKENENIQSLDIISSDGTSTKTSVRGVTDENGIVHYFVEEDDPIVIEKDST